MEKHKMEQGAYESLCRGRLPVASAKLLACGEFSSVGGLVNFYVTPAGMLIAVGVWGLPKEQSIYTLAMEGDIFQRGYSSRRSEQSLLPPLYAKNGVAWCSVLTKRLCLFDLRNIRLTLAQNGGASVACGEVLCLNFSEEKRAFISGS